MNLRNGLSSLWVGHWPILHVAFLVYRLPIFVHNDLGRKAFGFTADTAEYGLVLGHGRLELTATL
jgi:hypothetical protein